MVLLSFTFGDAAKWVTPSFIPPLWLDKSISIPSVALLVIGTAESFHYNKVLLGMPFGVAVITINANILNTYDIMLICQHVTWGLCSSPMLFMWNMLELGQIILQVLWFYPANCHSLKTPFFHLSSRADTIAPFMTAVLRDIVSP